MVRITPEASHKTTQQAATQARRGAFRPRRLWPTATTFVIMLALLPTLASKPAAVRADVVTISHDLLRTGWDPNEPTLTPAAVSSGHFAQMFSVPVNGQVYAQPLVVGASVFVATENDFAYSLNRTTGAINWSLSLGMPRNVTAICGDLTPNIGVTSTPVFDPTSGTLFLVALTVQNSIPRYSLFGINAQTGVITEQVPIAGSPTNDPNITFNAAQQYQRPGLLMMNGWVYAGFGSHCDGKPYNGFVAGVNVATHATTIWSDQSGVTDNEAGIWQSGGGLMSDGPGRIFFISGNGVSPVAGPGTSPPGQLAESVVRLAVQPDGSLVAVDFFSPKNAPTLDSQDLDFGSGGPVGLPFSTLTFSHMLVAAGKFGRIYLLNRDNLGGRSQGPSGTDASLRIICCFAGLWGHPGAFADTPTLTAANSGAASDFVYYDFNADFLREMRWAVDSTGLPNLHTVAHSANVFGFTSGSPVVTSNGTDPTSAIVWTIGVTNSSGASGTLYAFRAVPPTACTPGSPCTISPLWSAPIGTASKFTVPATDSGDVYLGTRDGRVFGFAVDPGPLTGLVPVAFGRRPVGTVTSKTITVVVTARLTVTGVSVSSGTSVNPFTVGQVTATEDGSTRPIRFPATFTRGDLLHAPVTFGPASPGGAVGALNFATRVPRLPVISVPLSGEGTAPGLFPISTSVSFALAPDQGRIDVPVGMTMTRMAQFTNYGTAPVTVTSVTRPAAPFFVSGGLPAPGTVIRPGATFVVQVSYAPTTKGPSTGSLTIQGNFGASATVGLAGVGEPPVSRFTASRNTVRFGRVRVGTKVTTRVRIVNTGNQPSVVTGETPPRRPFGVLLAVPRGLAVSPGSNLVITFVFRPRRPGSFAGAYRLSWRDKFGAHHLTIHLAGTGAFSGPETGAFSGPETGAFLSAG